MKSKNQRCIFPQNIAKIIFFALLGGLLFSPLLIVPVKADYVVIDDGDVVKLLTNLNYKKPDSDPLFYSQTHITLYIGETIPPALNDTYDRIKTMFPAFREQVMGMREGEEREFTLSYTDAGINETLDILYGADLIYTAEFKEMLYDVKVDVILELTLTHPVFIFWSFVLITAIAIPLYLAYNRGYLSKLFEKVKSLSYPSCTKCSSPTAFRCGSLKCNKPVCRSCFELEGQCPICKGTKLNKA